MTSRFTIVALGFLGVFLVVGFGVFASGWFSATATSSVDRTIPRNFILHDVPKKLPLIRFRNGVGRSQTLADFQGKVVLLNIWATWCGPCRREMPTLDRLQGELGGSHFEVVALSIDRGGPDVVRKFFKEIGVRNLALYNDSSSRVSTALKILGLPATLLVGGQGRELGRLIGPAEWNTQEMVAFFKSIITKQKTTHKRGPRQPLLKVVGGRFSQGESFRLIAAPEENFE